MKLPYSILVKGGKFYPQRMGQYFGSVRSGPKVYNTEEGARKFLKKQAEYAVKISYEFRTKYGADRTEYDPFEKAWVRDIDQAELVIAEEEIVTEVAPVKSYSSNVMKYIVLKTEDSNGKFHELPIMFPYVLVHKEMKECTWRALCESEHRMVEVLGAGFCTTENNQVKCYGESESLGIKSRGVQDQQAFARCQRSETSTIFERK